MTRIGWIAGFLLALSVSAAGVARGQSEHPSVTLSDITVDPKSGAAVQIQTTSPARYRAEFIDSPARLVFDFVDTQYAWRKTPLAVGSDLIKEIRGSQYRRTISRVVIEFTREPSYTIASSPSGVTVTLGATTTAAVTETPAAKPAVPVAKPYPSTPPVPAPTATAAAGAPAPKSAPSPSTPPAKPVAAPTTATSGGATPQAAPTPDQKRAASSEPTPPVKPATAQPAPPSAAAPIAAPAAPPRTPPASGTPPAAKPPAAVAAPARTGAADASVAKRTTPEPPAAARTASSATARPPAGKAAPTLEVARVDAVAAEPAPPALTTASTPNGVRLISLDFKDADVVNLLRILAAESGKNIVIGEDVKGKMSITLRNVPWQVALDVILESRGLQRIDRDSMVRIVSTDQLMRERDAAARLEEAQHKAEADVRQKIAEAKKAEQAAMAVDLAQQEAMARGPLREETIRLYYANPVDIATTLQGILGIPPQGAQASALTPMGGPPPIPAPPFSALFGPGAPAPPPPTGPSIEALSRGLTIQAYSPTNSIFIRYYANDLERIKKLIRETLDIPLPQVKISARLESLDRNALENLGITWGGAFSQPAGNLQLVGQGVTTSIPAGGGGGIVPPLGGIPFAGPIAGNPALTLGSLLPLSPLTALPTGGSLVNLPLSALPTTGASSNTATAGFSFGIIGTRFSVNLALQALSEQQKTRSLARPEVVTVENSRALIQLGREIPYQTVSSAGTQVQFKDAVLQLQVTPVVIPEGNSTKIKLTILVENNEQGPDTAAGPTIIKRRAETQVLVKEGEHLVIGGIAAAVDQTTVRKVPVLGDIPVIGWLFKQKGDRDSKSELVVFVTPSVLKTTQTDR